MMRPVETPRDGDGRVDYDLGWRLWTDTNRYYPSAVHRRRLIGNWLAPLAPRTLLDCGCGTGNLLDALRMRLSQTRFTGVDRAAAQLTINRAQLPWARFLPLDLGAARLDERFDAVVCTEVLEHIEDDDAALDHLVAMTGGHLLLTVPTGTIFPLEAGFGHLRHYQLGPLCRRLEERGLEIVRAVRWGFPWMSAFKRAANLNPEAIASGFADGQWSWPKKALGLLLTGLFYFNLSGYGPQLLILARRR
jgi:SAM-dependent methyltransferase